MYFRRHSSEWTEKHLPKPLYILLAVISLVVILIIGWFMTFLFEFLSAYANAVLSMYQ